MRVASKGEIMDDKDDKRLGKTYRAAFLGETVLTGPEHAHLPDSELLALAMAELERVDPDHATDADGEPLAPRGAVRIGDCDDITQRNVKRPATGRRS